MFWVVPLLSHKLWATFFLIKKQSVLFSWPRGICAILGVQASGRSIYICLSSSFLFWGLWGVSCYFLSPFPMGHWKDPQIWSPIYFLTWGKITLERALIVLGLCFCVENWELISFSKNVRSILGIAYFRAKHQKWANSDSVPALLGQRAHGPKSLEWVTPSACHSSVMSAQLFLMIPTPIRQVLAPPLKRWGAEVVSDIPSLTQQ